jgi:magnesium-protoporphyrin IX monomethyl ester (oxidative) cyclase
MPYGGFDRPSISLGLLKAYLARREISASVLYANLAFAETIGADAYLAIEETPTASLVGEWTFSRAAFPDMNGDEEAFFDLSRANGLEEGWWMKTLRKVFPGLDSGRFLAALRDQADRFVDRMVQRVLALQPRIVGCTSMFQQHCASLALLRRIKQAAPEVVTMIGGANCEGPMGQTAHRRFPWLDFVVSGEADAFFGELCQSILEGGPDLPVEALPEGVLGPAHRAPARRRPAGLTVLQAAEPARARAVLHSLDEAAVPDYEDYFDQLAASDLGPEIRPVLLFESSRGCWWGMKHHCTFCGLNGEGMTFRSKSAERVIEEITSLTAQYPVRWLFAVDNIIDMRHVKTVLPTLARLPDPPFLFYEVKANLKRDQLKVLRDAGVRRIQPGIESLHDEILKLLRKGNSWYINVQLLKWCQEMGIEVSWNLLSDVPNERDEWYAELAEWLPAIYHLEPPGGLSPIRYDRFSPYHDSPAEHGLQLVPNRAYAHVYPLEPQALEDMAYYFEQRDWTPKQTPPYRLMAERLEAWNRAFHGSGAPRARLLARPEGDTVVITDTRPGAAAGQYTLTGMDRRIWEACDSARSRDDLVATMRGGQASLAEVLASIERLKQRRVLVEWRGRLLAVTVNEPISPYPAHDQAGFRDLPALLPRLVERSLARQCQAGAQRA